ncbi:MAG: prolyl oligopeptidase family serine peptidase, partial [Actinomycetales bacterium]|nr:prolyl oligopeptidase family serine peptidase [Actinomycetales bacterium]
DQFGPTTDAAFYWQREMTREMGEANSPHRFVEQIVTPMLVIHGDKDYRVPIGEGLRLWYELLAHSGLPAGDDGSTEHRFLYFPNENHWILSPQHAKVWYQVVSGFLAEHVLGAEAPELPVELGRSAPTEKQLQAAAAAEEQQEATGDGVDGEAARG